jgi:hypothetical protein
MIARVKKPTRRRLGMDLQVQSWISNLIQARPMTTNGRVVDV